MTYTQDTIQQIKELRIRFCYSSTAVVHMMDFWTTRKSRVKGKTSKSKWKVHYFLDGFGLPHLSERGNLKIFRCWAGFKLPRRYFSAFYIFHLWIFFWVCHRSRSTHYSLWDSLFLISSFSLIFTFESSLSWAPNLYLLIAPTTITIFISIPSSTNSLVSLTSTPASFLATDQPFIVLFTSLCLAEIQSFLVHFQYIDSDGDFLLLLPLRSRIVPGSEVPLVEVSCGLVGRLQRRTFIGSWSRSLRY